MKPGIPKGTRDFGPEQVIKRNYIFDIIKSVFVKYGYQPLETPTMELLSTLTGKYGEEGDRLLFKVLKRGEKLTDAIAKNPVESNLAEEGLRYDLTVPFARYVVMNQNNIAFPFKRYQIQPVWRADRPQKGRYREFYQCDVDVIGSNSLMYEAELIQIYDEVFEKLGLKVIIKINNRKVLQGIAEVAGIPDKFREMVTALDKLDKIGKEGIIKEMLDKGIPSSSIDLILSTIEEIKNYPIYPVGIFTGDSKPISYASIFEEKKSEIGLKGIGEIQGIYDYIQEGFFGLDLSGSNKLIKDPTLARGLDYYTGCIFEIVVDTEVESQRNIKMGSIGGGGRYDDLTGVFGLKGMSGVGVSFGAERIYDVMEELNLFKEESLQGLKVLFFSTDEKHHFEMFKLIKKVRAAGISADLYPEYKNRDKQIKYAKKINVPYIAFANRFNAYHNEILFDLRNMQTESDEKDFLTLEELIEKLK